MFALVRYDAHAALVSVLLLCRTIEILAAYPAPPGRAAMAAEAEHFARLSDELEACAPYLEVPIG